MAPRPLAPAAHGSIATTREAALRQGREARGRAAARSTVRFPRGTTGYGSGGRSGLTRAATPWSLALQVALPRRWRWAWRCRRLGADAGGGVPGFRGVRPGAGLTGPGDCRSCGSRGSVGDASRDGAGGTGERSAACGLFPPSGGTSGVPPPRGAPRWATPPPAPTPAQPVGTGRAELVSAPSPSLARTLSRGGRALAPLLPRLPPAGPRAPRAPIVRSGPAGAPWHPGRDARSGCCSQ